MIIIITTIIIIIIIRIMIMIMTLIMILIMIMTMIIRTIIMIMMMMTDLEDFHSGLRGALTEHLEQHTQQLGVLHVGGHHHPCALDHLHPTTGLTRQGNRKRREDDNQETGQEEEEHDDTLVHKAEHRFLIAWLQCIAGPLQRTLPSLR